ncbi:unnamed protein product [Lathyrus oleraceus]|nr:F-box/kelch-repeat protein At3g23880-like isoform X1 [Pisum sativum]
MMFNSPDNARPKINSPSPVTAVPDELIAEVLSLLKVKSLLRLKCVSKSWNKLISDPFFVKIHFHKSSLNTDLTLFSAHHTGKSTYTQLTVYPVHTLLENNSTTSIVTVIRRFFSNEYHQVVGSCNGLCCLMEEYSNTEFREFSFRLCNPATKSLSHKLGYFRIQPNNPNSLFKFSFGYDNLTAKYKVVAFSPNEVRVFTLGDNNVWRNIPNFPIYPFNLIRSGQDGGLYVSNCLIWFADRTRLFNGHSAYLDLEQFVIISLNLGAETYAELLPPQDFDGEFLYLPNVCLLMECLCFSHHSNGNNIVIWQMRDFGVQESWTKLFNFSYPDFFQDPISYLGCCGELWPLYVLENGNILILANGEGQVIRYNRRDNRIDPIRISNTRSWFYVHRYVESLVSIC